jgi:5,10-methylene-tetrahydrofolate dehydrogenase/methenyl tetrahydrofolate cyclohydrolase
MKIERVHFPDLEVLLDFRCNPNSKTLYVRIKENLKAKGVTFKGNNIDLSESEVTEEELIEEIGDINEQKYSV